MSMPWCKANPWKTQSAFFVENALTIALKVSSSTLSAPKQGELQLSRMNINDPLFKGSNSSLIDGNPSIGFNFFALICLI
jgi:hypothetical protein